MSAVMEQPFTSGKSLIDIPDNASPLEIFTTDGSLDPFLEKIRAQIDAFVPDIATKKGRDEIASIAYKVAQSKSYLEGIGKRLADAQKEIPKKIDASRKRVRDTLDAWRDEVRAPLTKWEEAEKARADRHIAAITRITALAELHVMGTITAELLRGNLTMVAAVSIGPHLEEFETEYARAKDKAISTLVDAIRERDKFEAEQLELVRLRRESDERAQRDRDEAIAKEAAQRATEAAERASREEAGRIAKEAERQQAAAVAAEKAQREDSERRERDARLEVEAANRRTSEATLNAQREVEERQRREAKEAAEREADTAHRGRINRSAVNALVGNGIPEEFAKKAIVLIARRAVPAVKIDY